MKAYETRDDMVLDLVPAGSVVAEIGVFEGAFSEALLRTRPRTLYLVDPWTGTVQSGDSDGNNVRAVFLPGALVDVRRKFVSHEEVEVVRSTSEAFFSTLEDGSLDAVYLDAVHTYEGTMADLCAAARVVRPGGVIMGHDYEMNPRKALFQYNFGVKKAVDEFCRERGLSLCAKALDGCVSFAITLPL